ncbi:DNA polymerase I [Carboxydothermus ferrireducens]|uniref:DNA polymerase I n=1 Tax=Carboxydothermus ferrireducens DSM 11255 TaxID=1119529 RepID=A0ABX2REA0_9THEO|nr:DNA polymerase I [Carboxydothermus ferrireducens]NYE58406.1 DNA polymerase-1 [Carboxydothermus ferrireducens DSM 11255]
MGKVVLVDGNSLLHRAFFALPPLKTTKGEPTGAVYGFLTMLFRVIKDEKPEYLAVAFDVSRKTFRTKQFTAYKGHRKEAPDELVPQFALVREVLKVLNVPYIELDGYEADDIIGHLSRVFAGQGHEVVIYTADRDMLQLVDEKTVVYLTKKGITELVKMDLAAILESYGLKPKQLVDVKGLMGDPSDNIPGVPGIGEKTALDLIKTYGSVEEVLAHKDELKPKLREKLAEHENLAKISKQLATILREIPLEISLEDLKVKEPNYEEVAKLFLRLEFKSFLKEIEPKIKKEYQEGKDLVQFETVETEGQIAVVFSDGFYVDDGEKTKFYSLDRLNEIQEIFRNKKIITDDAKGIYHVCLEKGLTFPEVCFDARIAAYVLNPADQNPGLKGLYLKYDLPVYEDVSLNIRGLFYLKKEMMKKIFEQEQERLFYEIELPLTPVLAQMEHTGIQVDREALKEMSLELGEQIEELIREIYALAGEEFNLNSPKQLGVILFEKLGLPVIKKTKTGYSTDAEVLEELLPYHEIIGKILNYRQLMKLKSTYTDGLMPLINERTGKLHTTFNQTGTLTGRLASSEPNLQNIPIRLELGRKLRKMFIPSPGYDYIVSADYSQIELRLLAHFSEEPKLIEAYQKGEDIHRKTASEVFGVSLEEVTPEMRAHAKSVNFGIVYGISDFGLGRDLKIPREVAGKYIKNYFANYPKVREYLDELVRTAREKGYVTTLFGRRRYIPELSSKNRTVQGFGERTAMNTPLQGSAADIIKLAMINVEKELKARKLKSRLLLSVHDELVLEVPAEELEEVKALVKGVMESVVELKVPLIAEVGAGKNWYEAK